MKESLPTTEQKNILLPETLPARPEPHTFLKHRIEARGKFFFTGKKKFYVKGVTYGPFASDSEGCEYHNPQRVEQDFEKMAAWGFNTVRVYTVPPRWLLDIAERYSLRVMIGISWEQHITFLDDKSRINGIERKVRETVKTFKGHPAVFAYTIGNEIPPSIVRWYGPKKIEKFIMRLYKAGKSADAEAILTYVNFPTTEYLQLPFLDFVCFNVYLESEEKLESYLYRIQNLSGDKPLLMAELGLDSRRNGDEKQASTLEWQIQTAFRTGSAGVFIFSWTDEWFRGGFNIEDWDFGLVRRDATPKPALTAVGEAFREVPFEQFQNWPRVSVVVCSYNGSRTIRDCLEGLAELDYPNYEVIIVNDGSTDKTKEIAKEFEKAHGFRLVTTPNRGLSNARNTGIEMATGEIIAYTDDDARPDPHWLQYLAMEFMQTKHAAIGGPNIPPAGDGMIAECVSNAPGGPAHVLLSDRTAEHIPGCNMAFRKSALEVVKGFDPRYRAAGDDVDLCWRILDMGWTIGFSPAAMVWHHRRNSVKMYWKQQYGYGKAEALLEEKWPEKFNGPGHLTWAGRVYNKGLTLPILFKPSRIYQGVWGSAPFQSLYQPAPTLFASIILMPEWYLLIGILGVLAATSFIWQPLWLAWPCLALAIGALILQSFMSSSRAIFTHAVHPLARVTKGRLRFLTAVLHLVQPLARLTGRLDHGLTLWRRVGPAGFAWPLPGQDAVWSSRWQDNAGWLNTFSEILRQKDFVIRHGGDYDRWDLEVRSGMFASARVSMSVEDHGAGNQFVRFRWQPRISYFWGGIIGCLLSLSIAAAIDQAWIASAILMAGALLVAGRIIIQCSCAVKGVKRGIAFIKKTQNA